MKLAHTHLDSNFYYRMAIAALTRSHHGGGVDDAINNRAETAALLEQCRDTTGMIWVAEGGRDCDGVRYLRSPYRIEGSIKRYYNEIDRISRWADGPFTLYVVPPDALPGFEPYSRDLTLEAFENGHPHYLYD